MATVQTAIDPAHLPFNRWAEAMRLQNQSFPRPPEEAGWRRWAAQITMLDADAPNPVGFRDWRDWGRAWLRAV